MISPSEPAATTMRWQHATWAALLAIAAIYALRYLGLALHRAPDPDELQSLVNASNASRGLHLYLDYWDNHGPALTWLLSPLISAWGDDHSVFFAARIGAWFMAMLSAAAVYLLAITAFPHRRMLAATSVLMLFTSTPFMGRAIDIRPDNPVLLLWAVCVTALIRGIKTRRVRWWIAAGILLGLSGTFTLKVLPLLVSVLLICTGARGLLHPIRFKHAALLCVSAIVPLAVMCAILAANHTLYAWWLCVVRGSVEQENNAHLSRYFEFFGAAPLWAFLGVFSCAFAGWRLKQRRAGPEQLFLWPALFLLLTFIFFLPVQYLQSLLTAQVPQSVLSAWFLCEVVAAAAGRLRARLHSANLRKWALPAMVPVAVILFVFAWELNREEEHYGRFWNQDAATFVQFANRSAARIPPDELTFDPTGYVFLRAKVGRFQSLVTFLRQMHNADTIDLNIPETLQSANVRHVLYDVRTDDLRNSDVAYLRANFRPVDKAVLLKQPVILAEKASTSAPDAAQPGWSVFTGEKHSSSRAKTQKTKWLIEYEKLTPASR